MTQAAGRVHDGRDTVVPLATATWDESTANHAATAPAQRHRLARFSQVPTRSAPTGPRSVAMTLSGVRRPVRGFSAEGTDSLVIVKRAATTSTAIEWLLRATPASRPRDLSGEHALRNGAPAHVAASLAITSIHDSVRPWRRLMYVNGDDVGPHYLFIFK